jgi:hypothetical protein
MTKRKSNTIPTPLHADEAASYNEAASYYEKKAAEWYQLASESASCFVEKEARDILSKHRNLHEFVMGMGVWCFTLKKGDAEDPHPTINDEPRYIAKSRLARFISKWDGYLKITGEPMRFTVDGPVVRNW